MALQPGSIYAVEGRHYVDSQGVFNLAAAHDVIPQANGWRVLVRGGALACARVEGRPELPRQRGALYEVRAEGAADLPASQDAWVAAGLVRAQGALLGWPGEEARSVAAATKPKTACGCGPSCGCGPCRLRHGRPPGTEPHDHDHEHAHDYPHGAHR